MPRSRHVASTSRLLPFCAGLWAHIFGVASYANNHGPGGGEFPDAETKSCNLFLKMNSDSPASEGLQVDETQLSQTYEIVRLPVISCSQISTRTAAVIGNIERSPSSEKPVVVKLVAKSKAANKLVSIVEIAKRELSAKSSKLYQYNGLTSEMVEMPRDVKAGTGSHGQHGDG